MQEEIKTAEPIEITPNSIARLKSNNPAYQWLDYYTSPTTIETIALADFQRLYPNQYKELTKG